ncbi:Zn-ribbon domain-containing OB-fold protein [Streptomyces sp. NPDC056660]|uniref:Zn-ribbon domain-containing OB-fold protein n=1 Tax=Streptomyces sp. NPDC056660 TaxID=3345897 RepID=UPI0036BD91FE
MAKQIPLAEGLFTWPSDNPALLAGRCGDCEYVAFPFRDRCLACDGTDVERVELPRRGRLWTFTTQRFRPPSPPYGGSDTPETFAPFGVGYVELPGVVRVEARLTEPDPARLEVGQEMELVILPFGVNAEGEETMMFAFRPLDRV